MIIHRDTIQGSDEWLALRRGILTASEMHNIVTPTLKAASNDRARAHMHELLAQRITGHVEPMFVSDDMLRGHNDEIEARALYARHHAPVEEVGFITEDRWGFTIGYSPDGLVGDDGLIECKSRRQKYQIATILSGAMPDDYMVQIQTGLLVTGRQWCDFVSYCGGLPMVVIRVPANPAAQKAILAAAEAFEAALAGASEAFAEQVARRGYIATERLIEKELYL